MSLRQLLRNQHTVNFYHRLKPPRTRAFTHKPSLLLVAQPIPRPQLPFLNPVSRVNIVQAQVGRFISTERKKRWKENFWRQVRFHSYLWPSVFLIIVLMTGFKHVKLEQEFPTPREWSFWSRWTYRVAKYTEFDDEAKTHGVLTDWGKVGIHYKELLSRLESEKCDGKDIIVDDEEYELFEAVANLHPYVIEAKSEQWRRGYYEVLMGAARVAENLDGMCRRKGDPKGKVYPLESIPGPNNPRPKPLPWDKKKRHENPPNANEVEDAFPSPHFFYQKIFYTSTFNTRERVEAAMAYADWLDFKGQVESAETWYQRAVLNACFPIDLKRKISVVDETSFVINKDHDADVSENILNTCTALAVHYAKAGRVKDALPILLSVLRARKSLPPSPFGATGEKKTVKPQDDGILEYVYALKDLFIERPYPPLPSDGNERPCHTLKEACEEVGLMTYIGEILFATSESEREKGLSWTRDSIDAAEAVMWVMDEQKVEDGREKCRQCLETGLQNWKDMASQMAKLAAERENEIQNSSGFLGLGFGKSSQLTQAEKQTRRWEEETDLIELRKQKTLPLTKPLKAGSTG